MARRKHSLNRVFLGKPYNREFWWNTAIRILNEYHCGKYDCKFTRRQRQPDAMFKDGYYVGGVGTGNVYTKVVDKYKP